MGASFIQKCCGLLGFLAVLVVMILLWSAEAHAGCWNYTRGECYAVQP